MLAAQARELIWRVAEPIQPGEYQGRIMERAARRLGWALSRTTNIFRLRARVISAEEWIRLNEEAAGQAQKLKKLREAQHELDLAAARALGRASVPVDLKAPAQADGLDAAIVERPVGSSGPRPADLKRHYNAG